MTNSLYSHYQFQTKYLLDLKQFLNNRDNGFNKMWRVCNRYSILLCFEMYSSG